MASVTGLRRQVEQLTASLPEPGGDGLPSSLWWMRDDELERYDDASTRLQADAIAAASPVELTRDELARALWSHLYSTLGANHRHEELVALLDRGVDPATGERVDDHGQAVAIEAAARARRDAGEPPVFPHHFVDYWQGRVNARNYSGR